MGPQKRWLEYRRGQHAPALRRETGGRGCSPLQQPASGEAPEVGCTGARVPAPNAACRVTIKRQMHAHWHCTILVNTSPDTCRSILGTRSLRTSCNQWPAKVRVSTRSSGSSRSERCNWGAGPCPGRSRAAPSHSCRGRSSGTLRTGNLRRRGREAVTRWLLSPEIVFTETGFEC